MLIDRNNFVKFTKEKYNIIKNNHIIISINSLYTITVLKKDPNIWYLRMGYINNKVLNILNELLIDYYEDCIIIKQTKHKSIYSFNSDSKEYLKLIYFNSFKPTQVKSLKNK